MRVILTKHIRKVGKAGDQIEVKDGFGKNYLLPQGMAVRATRENLQNIETRKHEILAKNDELKHHAKDVSEKMTGKNLIFVSQCASDGRLFGSISTKMISSKLQELANFDLDYSNIILETPIKYSGVFKVDVAYHPEIISSLNIVVARSESEAQDMLVAFQQSSKAEKSSDESEEVA